MITKAPVWDKEALKRLAQRELGDFKLVIVSNRQPYIHELIEGKLSYAVPSGGLTTALDPLMQRVFRQSWEYAKVRPADVENRATQMERAVLSAPLRPSS